MIERGCVYVAFEINGEITDPKIKIKKTIASHDHQFDSVGLAINDINISNFIKWLLYNCPTGE